MREEEKKAENQEENKEEAIALQNRRFQKRVTLVVLLCALVLAVIGITFAWFKNVQQLHTVSLIQTPSRIILSGANRSELQKLSLELTPDDTKDEDSVTLRRVFCVESSADYWIELVNTTNIPNMEMKLYPVTAANSDKSSGQIGASDGVGTFYYTPDADTIPGSYLNKIAGENKIAIQAGQPGTLHDENYVAGDAVELHAEPLYWRTDAQMEYDKANYSRQETEEGQTNLYYRYYVLELSWDTSAQETDMIYLMVSL
ncbi:MAG: hypothetical protein Q4B73_06810 [Lachnospiraceae bacterium]|nr:hypothetical protein [Lachnospiraceae bacterium]